MQEVGLAEGNDANDDELEILEFIEILTTREKLMTSTRILIFALQMRNVLFEWYLF